MSEKKMKLKCAIAAAAESSWTKDDGYKSTLIFNGVKDKSVSVTLTRSQLVAVRDMMTEILYEMAKHEAGPEGFVITDDLGDLPRNKGHRCRKKNRS